jgi:Zn-dependent protease with chaperone function
MKQFPATFYDGKTAGGAPIHIEVVDARGLRLISQQIDEFIGFSELVVDNRLSGQPAIIELDSGGRIEVAAADAFFAELGDSAGGPDWVYRLESRWTWAAIALIVTILAVWGGIAYGIPTVAKVAADLVPVEVDNAIGEQGMELLDSQFLRPTELAPQHRRALRARFDEVVDSVGDGAEYRLEFRRGQAVGANALALPSGIIILTDELVYIAANDDEIAAVLAHEVGHVRHRHTLRGILQSSAAAALVIAVTGDIGSAANIAAGIPTFLVQQSYSRKFEQEADEVAFQYLKMHGIKGQPLADLLLRVEREYGAGEDVPGLLSTHPPSKERVN